jgi:hypothetical protein
MRALYVAAGAASVALCIGIIACQQAPPVGPSEPQSASTANQGSGASIQAVPVPVPVPVPGGNPGSVPVPGGPGGAPVPGGPGGAPVPGGPRSAPVPGGPGGGTGATPTPAPSGTPTPGPTPTPTPGPILTKFSFNTTTPAASFRSSPITVSGLPAGSTIFKVAVNVHLTGVTLNDFSKFASLTLEFPDTGAGFAAVLSPDNDKLSGTSLGNGCGLGAAATFDPEGTVQLENGTPPYSGTFQSFRGSPDLVNGLRSGDAAAHNGDWTLTIGNYGGGTYQCWSVDVYVCSPGTCPFP